MKKFKLLSVMLFAVAAMLGLKSTVFAEDNDGVLSIEASKDTVNPGDEVQFTVKVTNGAIGVAGVQGDIAVSSNLEYQGYTLGADLSGLDSVRNDGTSFSFSTTSEKAKGKDFSITFKYKVKDDAEAGDEVTFTISNALGVSAAVDEEGTPIKLAKVNKVTANSKATVAEEIIPEPDQGSNQSNPNTGDINLVYALIAIAVSGLGIGCIFKKRFN